MGFKSLCIWSLNVAYEVISSVLRQFKRFLAHNFGPSRDENRRFFPLTLKSPLPSAIKFLNGFFCHLMSLLLRQVYKSVSAGKLPRLNWTLPLHKFRQNSNPNITSPIFPSPQFLSDNSKAKKIAAVLQRTKS